MVDFAKAVVGPPRTVGELRIILEDFNGNKPNEWFGIEEARKAVSNLYWLLFRKSPNFEDWDGIVKELGGELDRRAKKGENWEVKQLSEIDNEVARVWNEAFERPEFETRALNSKQLEVLLRDLDDHLLEQGKIGEAIDELAKKYGLDKAGEDLLAQAVARKVEIQNELQEKLVGEGRPAEQAKREADAISDTEIIIEARVGEGKIEPKEMAEVVAKEVAVVLEIERKLEGETGRVVELVRETEARLRPELGDRAVEIAVAVANGAKPEEALLPELKAEARKRVVKEL